MENIDNVIVTASERLPIHIFDIIMSYFSGTPSCIAVHQHKDLRRRELQKRLNHLIKIAFNVHRDDGQWAFGFVDINDGEILQLQACNCIKCGNYCYPLSFEHTPKIWCNCSV